MPSLRNCVALKPEKVAVSASGTMKMGAPDMAAAEGLGRAEALRLALPELWAGASAETKSREERGGQGEGVAGWT